MTEIRTLPVMRSFVLWGGGISAFLFLASVVGNLGQTAPIILLLLAAMTIVLTAPLVQPSLLCIRFTDEAFEIVNPFWVQRVRWTDIERFTAVDLDAETLFGFFLFPSLIGYTLSAEASSVRPPFGWRYCREHGCHGMFWVPDGLSKQSFLCELRDRRNKKIETASVV